MSVCHVRSGQVINTDPGGVAPVTGEGAAPGLLGANGCGLFLRWDSVATSKLALKGREGVREKAVAT